MINEKRKVRVKGRLEPFSFGIMNSIKAETIRQRIEYLKLFQQGKKIWKKEKYWQE